jgi:O-antigen ligase
VRAARELRQGGRRVSSLARRPPMSLGGAAWVGGAAAIGVVLGLGTATAPLAGIALLTAPFVAWLLLRPAWLPPVLVVTVFAESLKFGGLTISRLSAPLALAVVVARLATGPFPRFPRRAVFWAVGAYVAFAFASAIWTVNVDDSFREGGTGFALASLGLSLVYMASFAILVETRADLKRLGVTIWVLAVALGALAIGQYLAGYARAVAYSGDANFFAALQVLALPVCLVVASHVDRPKLRLVALSGVAIVVGSVLVSLSRGGLLALFAVLALIAVQPARLMFRTRATKRLALIAVFIGAGVLLWAAFADLESRSQSLFNTAEGGSGRTNLWRAANTAWQRHPVRGIGYGSFPNLSNELLRQTPGVDFSAYRLRESGQVAHSAYLGTLAELGVIGLVLLLGVLAAAILTLRRTARYALARGDPVVAAAAQALYIAMLGFLLISLFLSTETDRGLWVLLGVTLALGRIAATPASMPLAQR